MLPELPAGCDGKVARRYKPGADGIADVVIDVRDGISRLHHLTFERGRHAPAFGEDVLTRL